MGAPAPPGLARRLRRDHQQRADHPHLRAARRGERGQGQAGGARQQRQDREVRRPLGHVGATGRRAGHQLARARPTSSSSSTTTTTSTAAATAATAAPPAPSSSPSPPRGDGGSSAAQNWGAATTAAPKQYSLATARGRSTALARGQRLVLGCSHVGCTQSGIASQPREGGVLPWLWGSDGGLFPLFYMVLLSTMAQQRPPTQERKPREAQHGRQRARSLRRRRGGGRRNLGAASPDTNDTTQRNDAATVGGPARRAPALKVVNAG